jgi:hypothetical protein
MREWPAGEDDWLISLWSLNEEDDGEMEQGADAADAARSRGRSRRPHVSRLDFLAQSRSSRLRRPHVPHDQGASLSSAATAPRADVEERVGVRAAVWPARTIGV